VKANEGEFGFLGVGRNVRLLGRSYNRFYINAVVGFGVQ